MRLEFKFTVLAGVLALLLGCSSQETKGESAQPDPTANELAAIQVLHDLDRGQREHLLIDWDSEKGEKKSGGPAEYAASLQQLLDAGSIVFIGGPLHDGENEGYSFRIRALREPMRYVALASPLEPGTTGSYYFAVGPGGNIYRSPAPIVIPESCEIPAGLDLVWDAKNSPEKVSDIPHPPKGE